MQVTEDVFTACWGVMTIIQAQVSDDVWAQLQAIAQQESLSIEQVVAQVLAAQA